ncbi:ARM repeat-containing protein [Dichomitus squalens]|uniref:ARM repeat-containing protein n=1 Tax=Dichomitus squalens TaxID=114155 RepID=A0A4V2K1H5_9APHY|nr:ARM repeat-containing protein [Dichomitus squalens]
MAPPSQAQPQPVSPEELYNVVCGAASQNPSEVQVSTDRLKDLLERPGAYDILHEIAAQKTVPLQVRQQAMIQFKNATSGHWRSRKNFPPEIKDRIRARTLSFLDETDDIIAECNALVVAKIARMDYPVAWGNLMSHLGGAINSSVDARYTNGDPNATLVLRRSLQVLNAVLKEYAGFKMLTGVKTMGKLVEDLRLPLQAHYARISSSLSSIAPASLSQLRTAEDLLLTHLTFKCLVKLAFWAYHRYTCCRDYQEFAPWVQDFFQNAAVQLQALSEMRIGLVSALGAGPPADAVSQRALDLLTRHVRVFGKLFRRMQRDNPAHFVTLPVCGDLVLYYWSKVVQATAGPSEQIADSALAVFPVRFLVQGMALFRDSLAQWAPVKKDGSTNDRVLTKEFVEDAVKILVTRFIPLNPTDLEEWMADPEEWVNTEEKENDQWEYELRPCGERVLMTLASQYPQYVQPLIQTTFNNLVGQRAIDLPAIIQKEALYCAVGRCAIRLKGAIPFKDWLESSLMAEAQETHPSYPIVKRRIAWLLGKLVADECLTANNPILWQVLVHLLRDQGPGSDAVVRLTAAIAIRECVDSLNFDAKTFAPFLPQVVTSLVQLTAEADSLEAKRRINDSLNTVIERAESRIVPLIRMVAEPIPQLWTAAEEDWLFKACLLGTVQKLVESAKENANSLSALVVPLVRECFIPPASIQLDQDAFALWQSALRNTNTIEGSPGLVELVPLIIQQLSSNFELLGTVVHILESYFLLDAPRILQVAAVDLLRAFNAAITEGAISTNIKHMTSALCLLTQVAPPALWGEAMHSSGLFLTVWKGLEEDKLPTIILTEYVYLLARIAVADRQLFLNLVSATAEALNQPVSQIWEPILNQWWTRFDNMSEPRLRKLTAMGIANLVSTGRPEVLDRLSTEICNLWIDVFGEIKEAQSNTGNDSSLTLYWDRPFDEVYTEVEGTLEHERRRAVFDNDPVRTTQLTGYIATKLREAEAACGGGAELQSRYLTNAEPTLLKQIYDAITGNRP